MSFNSNLISIENFLKASATSADALAARVNLSVYFNDVNATNFASLAASIGKILQPILPQIEEIVRIGHFPGFDLLAYGANVNKLADSKNGDDVGNALIAVIDSTAAIIAAVSVTALGFAVGSPFVVAVTGVSILASVYSSYNDQLNLSRLEAISQWGFNGLAEFDRYSQSAAMWKGYQAEVYQDYFAKNPATLPALLLVHSVDSNITPADALSFIENSGISNLTDQRIPEVSNFINSLSLLISGLNTPTVTTKEEINSLVDTLWNHLKTSPLAGNVALVDNFSHPFDASAARNDFGSFLSLVYLTPFAIKPLTPAAEQSLKDIHANVAFDWETDNVIKQNSPEQAANGDLTYSDQWVTDRIAMLSWLSASYNSDNQSISLSSQSLNGGKHFFDIATGKEVTVNGSDNVQHYIFGSSQDDDIIHPGQVGEQADHIYGGGGIDSLKGLGGDDYIEGGTEGDFIEGGKGNDRLLGGEGDDTYIYTTGDGFDTIIDSDGQGKIRIGETVLTLEGGKKVLNHWESADGRFYFTFNPVTGTGRGQLHITASSESGLSVNILVKHFKDGELGLNLPQAQAQPSVDPTIVGDLKPLDTDPNAPGIQPGTDNLGNLITDPNQPDPGREDTLYDSAGNDRIQGLGGKDKIYAFGGGDDILEGGAGNDVVLGGAGKDRLYANALLTPADILALADTGEGAGLRGDLLSGGTEDDELYGDTGNDALAGGEGGDTLYGGAGDDVILGDDGFTNAQRDWTVIQHHDPLPGGGLSHYFTTAGVSHQENTAGGDDVIYAGTGKDLIFAGLGSDIIDGGIGDELIGGRVRNLSGAANDFRWKMAA